MAKIKRHLWKIITKNSFLRSIGWSVYHRLQKNRLCIQGTNNVIDIQNDTSLPNLSNVFFDIIGDHNEIIIKKGAFIRNLTLHIRGNGHKVTFDENVLIKAGYFWFNDQYGQLIIGKGTTIKQAGIGIAESNTSVTLGEDCMLAGGIEIRTGDSHSILDLSDKKRLNPAQDVCIKNHVWIARHVQILKGVSIGCNSIIGTGAIVTKDIPENSLSVGVPAKVVKSGVTWTREKIPVDTESL